MKAKKEAGNQGSLKPNPLDDIEQQMRVFFASGKKIQQAPEGVLAETLRDRRGMNELTAAQALGKQTYASAKARRPKKESQIVLGDDDE